MASQQSVTSSGIPAPVLLHLFQKIIFLFDHLGAHATAHELNLR
jgi:hypothetical protein